MGTGKKLSYTGFKADTFFFLFFLHSSYTEAIFINVYKFWLCFWLCFISIVYFRHAAYYKKLSNFIAVIRVLVDYLLNIY